MQIVQLEEQKLSWKDYWCLVKLIWGNGNTKGIFLLLFALALETITKFEKEFALYFWIFLLMLAGMGLIYMWPYLCMSLPGSGNCRAITVSMLLAGR